MSVTRQRLRQIIKEELGRAGLVEGRWGRGSYDPGGFPRYGSSRMSDSEARFRGGRGYDEPRERGPRHVASGGVHSAVNLFVGKTQGKQLLDALSRLDSDAMGSFKRGYDSVVSAVIGDMDPATGYYMQGPRYRISTDADGYTFTVGAVVGKGATPTEALRDAASQGFEGSDVILAAMDGVAPLGEGRQRRRR